MSGNSSGKTLQPQAPEDLLRIGGFIPLSTCDWPGMLSAVVFCQGCPWRCAYCHNPHLQPRRGDGKTRWTDIVGFLSRRRGLLDAVVFSGGEPTLQTAIAGAMREARAMGFRIGLHTAGIHPRRLRTLLPLTDWVALDVKAPFELYAATAGVPGSGARALESLRIILASGIDHEVRTTVHPALLGREALAALAHRLAALGVRNYALQEFRSQGCNRSDLHGHTSCLDDAFAQTMKPLFPAFALRRA